MPAPSTDRDPRSVVTPDAFHVSPDLLGLPLALPRRRLAAVLLDLLFIGIVTVVTRSFALVLGVVVAAALVRAGFIRTPTKGNVFERARRASIGCLGLFVGLLTAGIWVALTSDSVSVEVDEASGLVVNVGSSTFNLDDAARATDPIEERDAQAVRDGVTLYTLDEVLERYATLRRAVSDDALDQVLVQALEERLMSELASDTLLALEAHIQDLEEEVSDAEQRRDQVEEELDDALSGGFLNWLFGIADLLGFGFGWAALYMTVWMSVTNGQTLGKRLLGLRVVRLDGLPINWWVAFERAGGYAAGFATGLLGFAQIFWDANRQAIHDRIVGTVVIREGLDKSLDWESCYVSQEGSEEELEVPEAARELDARFERRIVMTLPVRNNAKLRRVIEVVNADDDLYSLWTAANVNAVERLSMTDHGPVHVKIVMNIAVRMLRILADAGVEPGVVRNYEMTTHDAEVVVALAALLHDVGMSIHRADHEGYSLFIADSKLREILPEIYPPRVATVIRAEVQHAIISHRSGGKPLAPLEAGIVRIADALDMAKGRSRIPFESGSLSIHSVSAAAIESVSIERGTAKPIAIVIEISNLCGSLPARSAPLEQAPGERPGETPEINVRVGKEEKRLLEDFTL